MDKWKEFLKSLENKDAATINRELAAIVGAPVDVDKPYPEVIDIVSDKDTVSKDSTNFYFRITSPRVKRVYAIGANGEVQLVRINKEGLQTLSVSPLTTPLEYVVINDIYSAKGYDILGTLNKDIKSSMDLAELEKFFAVLDASVPAGNVITLGSGETKFKFPHLKSMRQKVKNYANKFYLFTGDNVDEDIIAWDYDEDKYRSIKDMVADLNVEIIYVGNYTLNKDGSDVKVIDPNTAYLVGINTAVGMKPFHFVRKDLGAPYTQEAEKDAEKQRIIHFIDSVINISGTQTAVKAYWGYEEMNLVCKMPLMLAKFVRS